MGGPWALWGGLWAPRWGPASSWAVNLWGCGDKVQGYVSEQRRAAAAVRPLFSSIVGGRTVGDSVGLGDALAVGCLVGRLVGEAEGVRVGCLDGTGVGRWVMVAVGLLGGEEDKQMEGRVVSRAGRMCNRRGGTGNLNRTRCPQQLVYILTTSAAGRGRHLERSSVAVVVVVGGWVWGLLRGKTRVHV